MKSKNLVSLTVTAVYFVLAITGLLIYLGQGNHFSAKHIHAWFGILFFVATVFHIINNWSSIKNYSVNRREGGFRKELILPVFITLVFVGGIAADLPVFKELANAGKKAFGPEKKKERGLAQQAVDSISRKVMMDYALAVSEGDTALLRRTIAKRAMISSEEGKFIEETTSTNPIKKNTTAEKTIIQVEQAKALDEHVIVTTGITSTRLSGTDLIRFTGVLNETDGHWQIAALQLANLPMQKHVAVR
ncbi:DUF4405 domain-containing protein [Spirosoma pollinicola]|uniref:Flavinylation-associated cytochrome domain-containing protein n=1 Tax=Spirosoma pollinicola TaxID=2057025 RepID=A0A2K8YSF5_9BACT|nr:DUF4405 domain-containing protein [Spirosoma pollinicola]AUD00562.1 hypothetical protein CWM47_01230 [Spirosoma pollinicola]